MSIQSVLLPVTVQIGLIFVLWLLMAGSRTQAFAKGLNPKDIALSKDAYPPRVKQYSNCFSNQFEIPVLFLFAVIFAIVLHHAGWAFVILEWIFVIARIGHAFIHTTSNNVRYRGGIYAISVIAVALMWLLVFIGVFFGSTFA